MHLLLRRYAFLNHLPSFIGMYCSNTICAFLAHWVAWMAIFYATFCEALPSYMLRVFYLACPVLIESILKHMVCPLACSIGVLK